MIGPGPVNAPTLRSRFGGRGRLGAKGQRLWLHLMKSGFLPDLSSLLGECREPQGTRNTAIGATVPKPWSLTSCHAATEHLVGFYPPKMTMLKARNYVRLIAGDGEAGL